MDLDAHRRRVPTRCGELSCVDVGQGPVALFVHGVGTSSHLWRHVIEAFAAERRCVAVDLPGHGHSQVPRVQNFSLPWFADLIEDCRDALDIDQVDLVANDTGGAIAQVFAASHTKRLRTLTLTNCDTQGNLPPDAFRPTVEMAQRGEFAPLAGQLAANPELVRHSALGVGYEHPERISDETLHAYMDPVASSPESALHFERLLASLDDTDLVAIEPELKRLTVPTLIVWGTGDPFFELRWAYWLKDTIPGVTEVVEIDGAKLFFPDERPDDLVPHLRRHWA